MTTMTTTRAPDLPHGCGSWVIVCRKTGRGLMETFERAAADRAAQSPDVEVLDALAYLGRVRRAAASAT